MRLDRWATLYVAQPLRATGLRSEKSSLPILMYHSISETAEDEVSPYYRTTTSPKMFAEQMDFLKADGWRAVTTSEGLQALRSGGELKEKLVVVTFDDGFADFYDHAFPALRKHRFGATMYLPTAFIGNERKMFKERHCLTWSQTNELRKGGIEFGSHTVNHPFLVQLGWEEIGTELRESKRMIEDRLECSAPAFAYPYAFPQTNQNFSGRFRETLRECGYESCVTTEIGRITAQDDPFCLKRLPANSWDDAQLLKAKLDGAYDWLRWPQTAVKSIKAALRG